MMKSITALKISAPSDPENDIPLENSHPSLNSSLTAANHHVAMH
jgi:hypothetical protein